MNSKTNTAGKTDTTNANGAHGRADAEDILARLNALRRAYDAAWDEILACGSADVEKALDDWPAKSAAFQDATRRLEELRAAGPKTKLDVRTGEYFLAEMNGLEVYHIELRRTETKTVAIAAACLEDAKRSAKGHLDELLAEGARVEVAAEDVGRWED